MVSFPLLLLILLIPSIFILGYKLILVSRQLSAIKEKSSAEQTRFIEELKEKHELEVELAELKNQISHDILHDPLTGLPSRQLFEDRFLQTLKQSQRYRFIFSIVFLDIDGFKIINAALGLKTGDELLKEMAKRLQSSIRQMDTVSRFTSDEFVFILARLAKPEVAAYTAQRLLNVIAEPFQIDNHELFVTASMGIATYPADGEDVATLLKNADNALQQAKAGGSNSYRFYREDMHALSRRLLVISASLHSPSIYQDLQIYYQARVDSRNKKVIGVEAFLYWEHADFGLIPLNEFLHLAENNGTIIPIGEWLMHHACRQFHDWVSKGFALQSIILNVSPRQLESPHFIYKTSRILQEMQFKPGWLALEVSDSMFLNKLDFIEKSLSMLKQLGVQIGMNDFGTGNIALQHLTRFPIDYVKISSSLIHNITVNKEDEAIVRMIIALTASLHLHVLADGVETEKQKYLLNQLGCYFMQGDFFEHRVLASEFAGNRMVERFNAVIASSKINTHPQSKGKG